MPRVFAYGALMARPHVLASGRHAVAPDHRLRFTAAGIPWIEPRFLALEEAPGEEAHGVVFDIEDAAWAEMSRHEITYERRTIRVLVDGTPQQAVALVLLEADQHPEGLPSARYAAMLHQGAAHHGLPDEVTARYAELERAGPQLTRRFWPLITVVRFLVPTFGTTGATLITALLLFGPPVALVLWWWMG